MALYVHFYRRKYFRLLFSEKKKEIFKIDFVLSMGVKVVKLLRMSGQGQLAFGGHLTA